MGVDDDDESAGRSIGGFQAAKDYIDPSTGQRCAFHGLEDNEDDFFCGPATNGIDYLRMVRYVVFCLVFISTRGLTSHATAAFSCLRVYIHADLNGAL